MNMEDTGIHWDMSRFYPSLESEEYRCDKNQLVAGLTAFIKDTESFPTTTTAEGKINVEVDIWAQTLCQMEKLEAQYSHLWFYTLCMLATDGHDEVRVRENNELESMRGQLQSTRALSMAALGRLSDKDFTLLLEHPMLQGAAHHLTGLRLAAHHALSDEKEALAADLQFSSVGAWVSLRNKISNKLYFTMAWPDGRNEDLPVSAWVNLMSNPDNSIRETAAAALNKAWKSQQDTIAACISNVTGARLALNRHRGGGDLLDESLRDNWIERETLSAMMSAVSATKSIWWRYLKLKAKLLGKQRLAIHDRLALLPVDTPSNYRASEAVDMIVNAFSQALPGQASYAREAINTGCVEYANGPGYSGTGIGGFAYHSPLLGETRVYTEYHGSLVDINILAHEFGHGYHSQVLTNLRHWQMEYPSTLAESASTVAEGLFRHKLIQDEKSPTELKLQVLSLQMDSAVNYLLRIPRDFCFESALYQQRQKAELSAGGITGLMTQFHDDWFGDSLDPQYKDEMHWASRAYFCFNNGYFINYNYTFGYLFSAALLRRILDQGNTFDQRYRALLEDTGSMNAELLAKKHLGVDISKTDFWRQEIQYLEKQLEQFEGLARQCFPDKVADL